MSSAKSLVIRPISSADARRVIRALHYSGKVDTRSTLSLGVFLDGRCGGAMQFGPSIDKRKTIGIVRDTAWGGYLELNRLAFADWLPRNSESRALGVAARMIHKQYPQIEWILSYADATQCGDGTIYRAAGFLLTGIKKNTSMWEMPDGRVLCKIVLEPGFSPNAGPRSEKARYGKTGPETSTTFLKRIGARRLPGWMLRYIRFLNPEARERLTVPVIPFSRIREMGASMYLGKSTSAGSVGADAPAIHAGEGGSTPTPALHSTGGKAERE